MKLAETAFRAVIIPWLRRREAVLPSVCYSACNNANLAAQSMGNSPALCESTSTFFNYYAACKDCLLAQTDDEQAVDDYLQTSFGQYLDYCGGTTPITASSPTTGTIAPSSVNGEAPTGHNIIITVSYTTTVDGVATVWPFQRTIVSYASIPDTAIVSLTTIENGHSTVWLFTTTFTHLSWGLVATSIPTSTATHTGTITASDPATTEPSRDTQHSQAWIAGPVVGAVAGVSILALAVWLLFRARLYRKRRRTVHEIHGEPALKSELEAKYPPQELDGGERTRHPVELPTNNP